MDGIKWYKCVYVCVYLTSNGVFQWWWYIVGVGGGIGGTNKPL